MASWMLDQLRLAVFPLLQPAGFTVTVGWLGGVKPPPGGEGVVPAVQIVQVLGDVISTRMGTGMPALEFHHSPYRRAVLMGCDGLFTLGR